MFHMGSTDQTLGAMMSGAAVVIIDGFDAEKIVDAIARHRIGWLLLMPGSIEPVVSLLQQKPVTVKSVKVVGAMADLLPTKLIAELSGLIGAPFLNSFGSTETGLAPASATLIPPGVVPLSLSKRQSAMCDVRLVDPDNNEVADGEPGEVSIRGPTVFSGYWNAPETNARDFSGGWFRMGDLFRRNPDNTFDFVDRAKYMIKSGGENVYPAEIERVLLADPRVADAVVVRKRDATWGEVPVAFIARLDETLECRRHRGDVPAPARRLQAPEGRSLCRLRGLSAQHDRQDPASRGGEVAVSVMNETDIVLTEIRDRLGCHHPEPAGAAERHRRADAARARARDRRM